MGETALPFALLQLLTHQGPMLVIQPRDHMESMNPHQMYYNNNQDMYQANGGYQAQSSPMQPHTNQRRYLHNSGNYSGRVCTHWQKHVSCPNKRCPYAASHTARNSPRYAKYMKNAEPPPEPAPFVPGPNALEIKDPSPNASPPTSREPTPPKAQARPFALEIKDAPTELKAKAEVEEVVAVQDEFLEPEQPAEQVAAHVPSDIVEPPRSRSRFA